MDGLLRACDEADGLKDGMIFNSRHAASTPRRWSATAQV